MGLKVSCCSLYHRSLPLSALQIMATMKAMKVMKAKRVSKRMAKAIAFRGGNTGGATTLKKADLVKSKSGRIVSKVKSMLAKKRYASGVGKWTKAVQKARKEMGVTGFVTIKKGTPLYRKAKEFYIE